MKILRGTSHIKTSIKNPVLTLGNFDGVHIGHQAILSLVKKRADEISGTSIVYTFEPHPLKILSPLTSPPMLTTFHKKMELLQILGIDIVICADFTSDFADQRPRDFAKEELCKKLGVLELFVGYDYKFGRGREGTIDYLKKMADELGFSMVVVDPVIKDGLPVSSTRIRRLIEEGDTFEASRLLGRFYSIKGRVVAGAGIGGKDLGYPTANIETVYELIPRTGVYAVYALRGTHRYSGIANIGFNPTFNRDRLNIEVHLFDVNEDMYGDDLEVFFIKRIRGEVCFSSKDLLKEQIAKDVLEVKGILKNIQNTDNADNPTKSS